MRWPTTVAICPERRRYASAVAGTMRKFAWNTSQGGRTERSHRWGRRAPSQLPARRARARRLPAARARVEGERRAAAVDPDLRLPLRQVPSKVPCGHAQVARRDDRRHQVGCESYGDYATHLDLSAINVPQGR